MGIVEMRNKRRILGKVWHTVWFSPKSLIYIGRERPAKPFPEFFIDIGQNNVVS